MKQVQSYKVEITVDEVTRYYTIKPYTYTEVSTEGLAFEGASIDDFFQTVGDKYIPYIFYGTTAFRRRPFVTLQNVHNTRFYGPKLIRARFYYKPVDWTYTLKDLFSQLSSNECLEYLRDNGLINCPLFQENT